MSSIARGARLAVASVLVGISAVAQAADRPLDAVKLVLRRSPAGKETLLFKSKDPTFLFPAIGGADDPASGTPGGAVVELFALTGPANASLALPAGGGSPGWTATDAAIDRYRFTNPGAPNVFATVRAALLRQGKVLKLVGKSTGLPLTGTLGGVGIRITMGTLRNCALFDAATIVQDHADLFVARGALATSIADCSAASLGGASCGNDILEPDEVCDGSADAACPGLCQPDCTCAPFCGDNQVNQPAEQCDGTAATPACPVDPPNIGCRVPGMAGACTCCSDLICPSSQCCDSSAVCIPGHLGLGTCVPTSCAPPHACSLGMQCGPGNLCCSPIDVMCFTPGFAFPCCAGLECSRPSGPGLVCCASAGTACSGGGDCCSNSCNLLGTCDP